MLRLRQTNPEVSLQRPGNGLPRVGPERLARHPANQLTRQIAPRNRVVSPTRPEGPQRRLRGEERGHLLPVVQVFDGKGRFDATNASLVGQQLGDRHAVLARLGKLRPVVRDRSFVVETAIGVQAGNGKRRKAFGRRVDIDQRVTLPGPRCIPVLIPAPKIYDGLTVADDANARSDLDVVPVRGKRVPDFLVPGRDRTLHVALRGNSCALPR